MTNTNTANTLAKSNYAHLLQHPNWQKKRLEILQRDNWKCVKCTDGKSTLHVHHIKYKSGCKPWEYENDNFETLCSACHEIEHLPKTDLESLLIAIVWLADQKLNIGTEYRINTRNHILKTLKERI